MLSFRPSAPSLSTGPLSALSCNSSPVICYIMIEISFPDDNVTLRAKLAWYLGCGCHLYNIISLDHTNNLVTYMERIMWETCSLVPRPPQAFIACSMKSLGRPGYEARRPVQAFFPLFILQAITAWEWGYHYSCNSMHTQPYSCSTAQPRLYACLVKWDKTCKMNNETLDLASFPGFWLFFDCMLQAMIKAWGSLGTRLL